MNFHQQFDSAWPGGYFEGSPLDPMSASTYGIYGYNSILYTIYLVCIRPNVTSDTVVLEIGPGRGAWTKSFLVRNCHKVYAVDVVDPERTRFWDYVGRDPRVDYIVAQDFSLSGIPAGAINFFFSFGVFCHLKPEMCEAYVQSLQRVMCSGAQGFLMIADFDKYEQCRANADQLSIGRFLAEQTRKVWMPAKLGYSFAWRNFRSKMDLESVSKSREKNLAGGGEAGWYHWGIDRACESILRAGFIIADRDIGVCPRDPVIHFKKP